MTALTTWAIEALLASAVLMAVVMAIRAPVRRVFGAQVAYALWALPVVRLLLPPLPESWQQAAATPITRASETITLIVVPSTASASGPMTEAAVSALPWAAMLTGAWVAVAIGFLGWHLLRHVRFCHRIVSTGATLDRIARVRVIESDAAPGPLAFGIVQPIVAFPRDFADRYDADERALALAHELGHHARGDLIANWVALVVLALHWFNPIAWRAFHAFRADQELANDARVLAGRSAYERHAYACAIVKAAHGGALSAACHLHTIKDLKGRLKMLRNQVSRRRIAAGAASVAVLAVAALGVTASGTRAAESVRSKVANVTGVDLTPFKSEHKTYTVDEKPGETRQSRVVIVRDGKTTTYEGAEADAYIAANPAPVAPEPPAAPPAPAAYAEAAPPAPPAPPEAPVWDKRQVHVMQDRAFRALRDMPHVSSSNCDSDGRGAVSGENMVVTKTRDGRRTIVICTDRIERQAKRGAELAMNAQDIQRDAMRHAMEGLRQARVSLAANRTLSEEARRDASAAIEESMAELEQDAAERD